MSEETTMQPNETAQPEHVNSDESTIGSENAGNRTKGARSTPGTIREILYKLPGTHEQIPATQTARAELQDVNATTVIMDRSGAERITADRVSMDRAGARTIDAKSAQLDRSGALVLGSDHTVLLHSSAVHVTAEEVRVNDSRLVLLRAAKASVQNSRILLFSGSAEGNVTATMTTRGAAMFGAALGLVLGIFTIFARSLGRD